MFMPLYVFLLFIGHIRAICTQIPVLPYYWLPKQVFLPVSVKKVPCKKSSTLRKYINYIL